jgi:hypothetical protein
MSTGIIRGTPLGSRELLARILEQPSLVAAVQSLPAPVLGRLIAHIGLEDAGEIVALATTEQLRAIFDEDLWRSERPGKDETFDADRFGRWLEIMLEAGEAFAAERLVELPEDLVTLALGKHVLVVNIEELAISMSERRSHDDVLLEKALESCLCEEIGEYRIISRRHEGWDAVLSLLLALDRDHHAYLARLLERCCYAGSEHIEDNGGLYNVLTSEEMLEGDAAAEREDRRAAEGYVSPASAASFLALARTAALDAITTSRDRDPVTRAYFRTLAPPPPATAPAAGGTGRPAPMADAGAGLVHLMREAEVLPPARWRGLLGPSQRGGATQSDDRLAQAMRRLREQDPKQHTQRMEELGYLANVLVAGCILDGRAFRPAEAARAVLAVCNLGLEYLHETHTQAVDRSLARGADWLFRIGWRRLAQEVAGPAASIIAARLLPGQGRQGGEREARELTAVRAALLSDKPWTARADLELHAELGDAGGAAAWLALIDECPHLAGRLLGGRGAEQHRPGALAFIATREQLRKVSDFLARLPP